MDGGAGVLGGYVGGGSCDGSRNQGEALFVVCVYYGAEFFKCDVEGAKFVPREL